jgi:integrase
VIRPSQSALHSWSVSASPTPQVPQDAPAVHAGDIAAVLAAVAAAAKDPAKLKALAKSVASGDDWPQVFDTRIGIESDTRAVSNLKGRDAMRYYGPYQHGNVFRVLVHAPGKKQKVHSVHATESEAIAEIRKLRIAAARYAGTSTEKAIVAYEKILTDNGLKPRSVETTGYRLRRFFQPVLQQPLCMVTPNQARELFTRFYGSVDSRKNVLAEVRTFSTRARERGWLETPLLEGVRAEGKRRCGKPKLTIDESKKFLAVCLLLAASPDPRKRRGGIAAAMALVFGMRASEITGLQVKDLDAGGTIIRITRAKSRAGVRALQVPAWFKPYLMEQATGKEPTDLLIGKERTWLHRTVKALCRQAGVTEVPPHGLRGTHGDLALTAAVSPQAVSQALGHESQEITFRHYADRGLAENQEHIQAMKALVPAPPN